MSKKGRYAPVPSRGPKDAKILIIVESPDREDEKKGKLLAGSLGRLLDSMLHDAGIKMNQCRIISLLKNRPYAGRFDSLYEDRKMTQPKDALMNARRDLEREIKELSPNVIVPLGTESLRAVLGDDSVTVEKWRGSILHTKLGKVIPSFTPERVQRQYINRALVTLDFKKVEEESHSPEINLPERDLIVAPDLQKVKTFLAECRKSEYLAFDIETIQRENPETGVLETHIDCIGFAPSESLAMSIPISEPNGKPYWTVEEESQVWLEISKTLYDPRPKKIAQNGQYDILILDRFGIRVSNFWADTLNMAHTLHSEFPKNLDFLVSVYTREPYYGYMISEGRNRWRYNAKDAAVTYEIAFKLLEDLETFGTKDFYFSHVHPLLPIYQEVQKLGVLLDEDLRKKSIAKVERGEGLSDTWSCSDEMCNKTYKTTGILKTDPPIQDSCCKDTLYQITPLEDLNTWLEEELGYPLNVNSPKQMQDFLYKKRGYPVLYNKEGNPGSDEKILNKLYAKYKDEALLVILAIRAKRKLISTYLKVKADPDGRVRSSWMVTGTETGRLSSSKSVDGTGWNSQNVPEGPAREMIVADPGHVFVGADAKQAEARAVAYLADDPGLISILEGGKDIYKDAATRLFDVSMEDVTPEQRALAKTGVLSANYGIGPTAFGEHAKISLKEAKEFLNLYFDTFVGLRLYQKSVENEVKLTRTLTNSFGRKRRFYDRISDTLFREAYAYLPQSGVVDMIHRATKYVYERLPQGAQIVLQVHDCIIVQCLEEQAEEVAEIVETAMTLPWRIGRHEVSIPASANIGPNWQSVS